MKNFWQQQKIVLSIPNYYGTWYLLYINYMYCTHKTIDSNSNQQTHEDEYRIKVEILISVQRILQHLIQLHGLIYHINYYISQIHTPIFSQCANEFLPIGSIVVYSSIKSYWQSLWHSIDVSHSKNSRHPFLYFVIQFWSAGTHRIAVKMSQSGIWSED
jgi:hypothetical protein